MKKLNDELANNFHDLCPTTRKQFQQKRPSISSSLCQRAIALNGLLPTREVPTTKTLGLYADLGNTIEDFVVDKYRTAGQLVIDSWKLPTELLPRDYNMGGIIDMIIVHDNQPILVDIKSVGQVTALNTLTLTDKDIDSLQSGEQLIIKSTDQIKAKPGKSVKEVYNAQVQLYAAITGIDGKVMMVSRRVQDGYDEDGNLSLAFKNVPMSDDELAKRMAVVFFGIECRENKILPNKLKGIKKTHCSHAFCSYVDYCWNGGQSPTELYNITLQEQQPEHTNLMRECYEYAQEYVSMRHERAALTMQLIENELQRRKAIMQDIDMVKKELDAVVNKYDLYPWSVKLGVKF